jgi:pimeloyl-ACP methyl ester carboxylesterase
MPIKLGRRLFDAAPNQSSGGIPKRFVELPTAGHNDVLLVAEAKLRRAVREFLDSLSSGLARRQ